MFKNLSRNIALLTVVAIAVMFATNGHDFHAGLQLGLVTAMGQLALPYLPKFNTGYAGYACDDLNAAIAKALSEVKTAHEGILQLGGELKAKYEGGEKVTQTLKETVDDLLTKFNETKATLNDIEQKAATGGFGKQVEVKSFGEQFIESEGFKSFNGDEKTSVKATITTTLAGGAAGRGLMTPAYRDGDLVSIPRRVTVDDLIPSIQINSSSVDFARQLTRNNNAAAVAEGTQKPYSDYSWESATVPVRTMAHLVKVTRQAWEDAPRLMGEINSELIYGLDLLREAQVLFGNGTGQNLTGIVPQARVYAKPAGSPTANLTRIDVIRLAILNVALRGYTADGVVLNSADWAYIELGKDGQQRYMVSDPLSGAVKRLWSLPVLDTVAMAQDNFLVGGFRIGASLYRRMGIEIKLSTENDKDFELNLGTVRGEERIALAVKRRDAFETGTFTAATA